MTKKLIKIINNYFPATELSCSLILVSPSSIVVRVCLESSKLRCSTKGV